MSILIEICELRRQKVHQPEHELIEQDSRPYSHVNPFWHALCFFAVATAGKIVHLQFRESAGILGYLVDLAIATHADVLCAMTMGGLGALLVPLARRWPRVGQWMMHGFAALMAGCVLYSLVSIFILAELRTPLTYRLICLAGDLGSMRSSLAEYASDGVIISLVAGVGGYILLARLLSRKYLPGRRVLLLLIVLATLQWIGGRFAYARFWQMRPDQMLAENPHWTLLSSAVMELVGDGIQPFGGEFPPEYELDFQPPPPPAPLNLPRRPRNVIFFVLESVAAQHMSLYGSPFPTTPNLEAEAAHSLIVDRFYAHVGISATSLMAMSLSRYPKIDWRPATQTHPNAHGIALPQILKQHGYRTLMVTSTDFSFAGMSQFLAGRGFDAIIDAQDLGFPKVFSWGTEDRHMIDRLIEWIDEKPGEPFFAMTWTGQTHHPYAMSPNRPEINYARYSAGSIPMTPELNRYLNALREADAQLGRLFEALRQRGMENDTLVVITGDHGEAFGWPHDQAFHGQHLYDENVNVPCVLWAPGAFTGGARPDAVAGHIDLNPTILHILGIDAPEEWIGRSILDPNRASRTYFFAAGRDYMLGVREAELKYIYNATTGREMLFDLGTDPLEKHNLAATRRGTSEMMRSRLNAWTNTQPKR